jgi:hypothetical protein
VPQWAATAQTVLQKRLSFLSPQFKVQPADDVFQPPDALLYIPEVVRCAVRLARQQKQNEDR